MKMRRAFITGTAGFIGYHLADLLLQEGWAVTGYDGLSDYYDVGLKRARHARLGKYPHFEAHEARLEDAARLDAAIDAAEPEAIIHLAAQAGVRYSMEDPASYVSSNMIGTFHVIEAARRVKPAHLLMASTSSVYGAITEYPYHEGQHVNSPLNIYAASKGANELMGHAYANLYAIPTTMFRFFTVYGPWGRPDMALFKFVEKMLRNAPIDIYNHGKMARDFTYVSDLVRGIRLLIDAPPPLAGDEARTALPENDSISPVAPFRVVNIGNSTKVPLLEYIDAIEAALGRKAQRNYLPLQPGEVLETHADARLLQALTGYAPRTDVRDGVQAFVDWYLDYYRVNDR